MIILSENLNKYERVLNLIYQKGDRIGESLYLDFKSRHIYFQSNRFIGKLQFDFKLEENEELPVNFWVNAPKFLMLVRSYSKLLLKGKVFYNPENKGENFTIDVFEEEFEDTYFMHVKDNWNNYNLSEETLGFLRESYPYTSDEFTNNFKGVYLNEHNLIATDRSKFYCVSIDENFNNFYLHIDLIKVILPTNFNYNEVTIYHKDVNTIISLSGGELEVLSSEILDFEIPPISDPDFIANYNHESFITFSRQNFLEILRFMDFFIKDLTNKRICISIITEKEKGVVFIESIEQDQIKRILPTVEVSINLIGEHFYISLPYIQMALNTFDDDIIKLQINPEMVAVNFTAVDENVKKHVVLAKIDE